MRSATVILVLLVLCTNPISAHNGRIALFTDTLATDCNTDIGLAEAKDIYLLYIRGDGPIMLQGYELRLHVSTGDASISGTTWPPGALTFGDIETGISVALASPLGPDDIIWIGTITILNTAESGTFLVSVVDHPTTSPPGINIIEYPSLTTFQVLGSAFVFNGECNFDNTWYVKPDSTGETLNIQAGIDFSFDGDTVLASPGTFFGDGNRDIDFMGKEIVVRSELGADSTIVSCGANEHRGFYFHSGEDTLSILEGFTITFGSRSDYGGGIACVSSSPTIKDNIIEFNECNGPGKGIYCKHSSARILNNTIRRCEISADSAGGGIYCDSSSVTISGNTIKENLGGYGGGIHCRNGTYEISYNTIDTNRVSARGGGIYCYSSDVRITENVITRNGTSSQQVIGGGIYLEAGNYEVCNNTISHNDVNNGGGGGIFVISCSQSTVIEHNTLFNNVGNVGGLSKGGGIYCNSPIEIRYNIIDHNVSAGGGGIYCDHSSPLIIGNTIINNEADYGIIADYGGGGINCYWASPVISQNIICYNSAVEDTLIPIGGGIYCDFFSSPAISCCDVYDNEGGNYFGIADQTGINGNISLNPNFCDAGMKDYSLRTDSPCLPGNHPDGYACGLIGALGWGCSAGEPFTFVIEDVGNDQGRQVTIGWHASMWDTVGSPQPIITYEVYRRIDDLPAPPTALKESDEISTGDNGRKGPLAYPPGDWHYLFDVPAHCEETYRVVAPTLEDSCVYNTSDFYSVFFVRATTNSPGIYFDSAVDSGYSIDNLSPATPCGFNVSGSTIDWDENEEPDLSGYHVYAKAAPEDPYVLYTTTQISEFDVTQSIEDGYRAWCFTSYDYNGNESEAGAPSCFPTGDDPVIPLSYALMQNHPNPFNPSTTIQFEIPERTWVTLVVYNVQGQIVKVLYNEKINPGRKSFMWNGTDENGNGVASGMYFYQLVTPSFTEAKKMILIR